MCCHAQKVTALDGVDAILAAMHVFALDANVQQQAGKAIVQLIEKDEAMRVRAWKGQS